MNNASVINDTLKDEATPDVSPLLNRRAEELGDIIEALQNIAGSTSWKVLRQLEFNLQPLLDKLGEEKEPVEIYRLQGEIKRAKKYDFEKLLASRRQELDRIKSKLKS